jgi:flagellin
MRPAAASAAVWQVAFKRRMSSIRTNASALSALRSLTEIQKVLAGTERQISIGLAVSTAADNASYWSIAAQLGSDCDVVKAANLALAQSQSALSAAATAIGAIASTINAIGADLTQASNPSASLDGINASLASLGQQLTDAVVGASFNGLNLLDGSQTGQLDFTAGFNATSGGGAINTISFFPFPLINVLAGATSTTQQAAVTDAATINQIVNLSSNYATLAYGVDVIVANPGRDPTYALAQDQAGTATTIATGGTGALQSRGLAGAVEMWSQALDGTITSNVYTAVDANGNACSLPKAASLNMSQTTITGGGLLVQNGVDLTQITVYGAADAQAKLAAVEAAGKALTIYAATIGAAQNRMTAASTFNSALTTNYATGVSALVDADMNTVSTRLQALQTQEQLGIQSLSIANQDAQLILTLFP